MEQIDQCRLCKNNQPLRQSHIVPKFVADWLKQTGASDYFREMNSINKREQDFPKANLLCANCEILFSKWEKKFSETIFKPFHNNHVTYETSYEDWLVKFVISVNWRVLILLLLANQIEDPFLTDAISAEEAWRLYLLSDSTSSTPNEHHIFFIKDLLVEPVSILPFHFYQYIHRAVESNRYYSESNNQFGIYTKLPGILLLSMIRPKTHTWGEGTKIYQNGSLTTKQEIIDKRVIKLLINNAVVVEDSIRNQSESQQGNIIKFAKLNITRLAGSLSAQALEMDYYANLEKGKILIQTGRNDPCPCGSGEKFKKCCLNNYVNVPLVNKVIN